MNSNGHQHGMPVGISTGANGPSGHELQQAPTGYPSAKGHMGRNCNRCQRGKRASRVPARLEHVPLEAFERAEFILGSLGSLGSLEIPVVLYAITYFSR